MKTLKTAMVLILIILSGGLTSVGIELYHAHHELEKASAAVATSAQAEAAITERQFTSTTPARKTLPGAAEAVLVPKLRPGDKMGVLRLPGEPPILIRQGTNDMDREENLLNTGSAVHYVDSAHWFGPGVFAMSGHRTTYGAVFSDLDLMHAGDIATISTRDGRYRYRYHSTRIVSPNDVWVINPLAKKQYRLLADGGLVLTACHPKHSAQQRIVVFWRFLDYTPRQT